MTTPTITELREARRYVDRLVKRGAIIAPLGSPFVQAMAELLHLATTDNHFGTPTQPYCKVCLRRPSPGLRTVVGHHPTHSLLIVGRLCRDCRPGRVA